MWRLACLITSRWNKLLFVTSGKEIVSGWFVRQRYNAKNTRLIVIKFGEEVSKGGSPLNLGADLVLVIHSHIKEEWTVGFGRDLGILNVLLVHIYGRHAKAPVCVLLCETVCLMEQRVKVRW